MRGLSKAIFISVTIAVVVVLLVVADKSFFKLDSITVAKIDDQARDWLFDDIRAKVNLETKSMLGKYVWEISLDKLMSLVEKDKRVDRVQVKRKFPNRIEVKLLSHEPIALYLNSKKEFIPVARDGTLMPNLSKGEFLDVPILRGSSMAKDLKLRKKAMELLLAIDDKSNFSRKKVSEVLYNKKKGFRLVLNPDGEILKMGTTDFQKRIGMVEKVLAYLDSKGLKSRVIDVRFSKKVVVRLRNAP